MNTYIGDVVLDPFVGSGSTAVAAVRTGRHYIGYDTDASYIEAARRRVAAEQVSSVVEIAATDGRVTDPFRGGWSSKEVAKWLLTEAGYTQLDDQASIVAGAAPTLRGVDPGRQGVVVRGRRRPHLEPSGAQRIDLLWRAIAKGAIAREDGTGQWLRNPHSGPAHGRFRSAGSGGRDRTRQGGSSCRRHAVQRRRGRPRRAGDLTPILPRLHSAAVLRRNLSGTRGLQETGEM